MESLWSTKLRRTTLKLLNISFLPPLFISLFKSCLLDASWRRNLFKNLWVLVPKSFDLCSDLNRDSSGMSLRKQQNVIIEKVSLFSHFSPLSSSSRTLNIENFINWLQRLILINHVDFYHQLSAERNNKYNFFSLVIKDHKNSTDHKKRAQELWLWLMFHWCK